MFVSAIVVAAGKGTRFGGAVAKQFLELNGKPVIYHALRRFEDCADVDEIVVVLSAAELENYGERVADFGLKKITKIAAGGATRHESVRNGLAAIDDKTEIVAIHDGARPLVTVDEIRRTVARARETGAACLVAPVTDTIKEIDSSGNIVNTVDRATLRRALTPQCFRRALLEQAFADFKNQDLATDESFLVEQFGQTVATVEGSARNIKITVAEDLILAEALLKEFQVSSS